MTVLCMHKGKKQTPSFKHSASQELLDFLPGLMLMSYRMTFKVKLDQVVVALGEYVVWAVSSRQLDIFILIEHKEGMNYYITYIHYQ